MKLAVVLAVALEIVPGVHLIRGTFTPGSQPDGNTIIVNAPEGLVVVDTGRHVEHTQRIVDFVRAAKKPVKAIVNTHWHLDHVGGNVVMRREFPDAKVYASGALTDALKGFLANYRKQMLEQPDASKYAAEIALIDAGPKLAPDQVLAEPGRVILAGRAFEVGVEKPAVTAGDVWLFDPATGVLIAGDLVTLPVPFLDTACPPKWEASLDKLSKVDFDLLVPGHGPPLTRRQFATYRKAFSALLACKQEKGTCVDGWMAAIAPLIPAEEGEFARMLMGYYVDLRGRACE